MTLNQKDFEWNEMKLFICRHWRSLLLYIKTGFTAFFSGSVALRPNLQSGTPCVTDCFRRSYPQVSFRRRHRRNCPPRRRASLYSRGSSHSLVAIQSHFWAQSFDSSFASPQKIPFCSLGCQYVYKFTSVANGLLNFDFLTELNSTYSTDSVQLI